MKEAPKLYQTFEHQFELEQRIMQCWHIVDDIRDLYKTICDGRKLDEDELANVMLGLETMYDLKFSLLFTAFENHLAAVHGRKRFEEE